MNRFYEETDTFMNELAHFLIDWGVEDIDIDKSQHTIIFTNYSHNKKLTTQHGTLNDFIYDNRDSK